MKKSSEKLIDTTLINQAEYARRLNVSRTYISLILSGKRSGPKAQKLLKRIIAFHKSQHLTTT